MATKFHRETELSESIEARRTPWMRQTPHSTLSRRHRMFIIFMGMLVVVLLGQIAYRLNVDAPYVYQPVLRTVATIVDKGIPEHRTVTVEIVMESGATMTATWPMPKVYWEKIQAGDRVGVLYRMSKQRDAIQLVECGLVALPE